jgi:glycosyltransferase involved in cell wall biosynthesis
LAEYVDYIIVTSDALKDKFSQHNGKVYQIKLGAPNVEQETELTFSKNQNIKVAFVGFLSKTNDLKVFLKLLSEGVDINLFGSIKSAEVEKFIKHKNFHYHGVVTGNDLYKELNKCDVGIAPYSKKEVNSGGTPNKLWLYLAVGLPVVVTNLSTIKKWTFPDRSVYRSEDNSDFSELVNFAYQENSVELFNSRIEFARINSWDSRMADFIEIIKSNEPTHPTA